MNEELFSNGKTHREVLDDVCSCGGNCLLKELVLITNIFNDRTLDQFKCIEAFKYERSSSEGRDIGWKRAVELWMEEGYAAKFAEIYSPEKKAREIYNELMQRD